MKSHNRFKEIIIGKIHGIFSGFSYLNCFSECLKDLLFEFRFYPAEDIVDVACFQ